MSLFDRVKQDDFDNFRHSVAAELQSLHAQLDQSSYSNSKQLDVIREFVRASASVSDEVARQAADNAVNSQRNIAAIESNLSQVLLEINEIKVVSSQDASEILKIKTIQADLLKETESVMGQAHQTLNYLEIKRSDIDKSASEIAVRMSEINTHVQQSQDLPTKLEQTSALLGECKRISDSIHGLLTHSVRRKAKIDELYTEIYGEDIVVPDGNTEHVNGLKDELDMSFAQISRDMNGLEKIIQSATEGVVKNFTDSLDTKSKDFNFLFKKSSDRFDAVDAQLTGLLPGAMAAGLSAAYEEKKNEEIDSLKSFDRNFRTAILTMISISLIPLAVNTYLIFWKRMELLSIIKDTPNIIIAILPLYFPVLWLAYSANKKSNLSKRLIEEYTHKAVLGKTFSGLSNQIETLQHQGAVKEELRTKLLFNVLQVSAENPGKLITNYSKSDHPLMDALENSAKLADSIGALAKIPGFSALASKLSKKADEVLKENTKKVEDGLQTQEMIEVNVQDDQQSAR